MNCFIFTNCQGSVLSKFIPKKFNVTYKSNYAYVYNKFIDEDIKKIII